MSNKFTINAREAKAHATHAPSNRKIQQGIDITMAELLSEEGIREAYRYIPLAPAKEKQLFCDELASYALARQNGSLWAWSVSRAACVGAAKSLCTHAVLLCESECAEGAEFAAEALCWAEIEKLYRRHFT